MTRAALIALALATPAHALPIAELHGIAWIDGLGFRPVDECHETESVDWTGRHARTHRPEWICTDQPYGGGKGEKWTTESVKLSSTPWALTEGQENLTADTLLPALAHPTLAIAAPLQARGTFPTAGIGAVCSVGTICFWSQKPGPKRSDTPSPITPSPVPLPASLALLLVGVGITWAAARKG